jgi:hypothetical protein
MEKLFAATLATVVLACAGGAGAAEVAVFADGRGWIDSGGTASGGLADSNYIAGFYCLGGNCQDGVVEVRNYFTFDLPDLTEGLVSAVLELDSRWLRLGGETSLTYQLTSTAGFTFDLLGGGEAYGQSAYGVGDDEMVRQVALNATALDAIRNAGGGSFALSGKVLAPVDYSGDDVHYAFGNTHDPQTQPVRLLLTTAPVPEPGTWALMVGGFGLAGGTLRRRRLRPT